MARKGARILEAKYFGLILGLVVFGLILLLSQKTILIESLERKVLDFNFRLKTPPKIETVQENVIAQAVNPSISEDIILVGIDDASLNRFGRWPFPRYRYADMLLSLARIKNQDLRESAVFLDAFFVEPNIAEDDALLATSMAENGRLLAEAVMDEAEIPASLRDEYFGRMQALYDSWGTITNIQGDWTKIETFHGVLPPLKPFARGAHSYGHANFIEDPDQVYRRQGLVVKLAREVQAIPLEEVGPGSLTETERASYMRLEWVDRKGIPHDVPYPMTDAALKKLRDEVPRLAPPRVEDTDGDGTPDRQYFVVRKYQDTFLPAVTLSLALQYYNKRLSDIEVVLGKDIRIPSPQRFNTETGQWEKARRLVHPPVVDGDGNVTREAEYKELDEVLIPIDEKGRMLINFMGIGSTQDRPTYPLRSLVGYAVTPPSADPSTWRATRGVAGKILMVGAFSKGIAEDEKTTPFGLMYGVEIHANALNTILMDTHPRHASFWVDAAVLFGFVALIAFLTSRVSTLWSLVISLVLMIVHFLAVSLLFELTNTIVNLTAPLFGILLTFLAVVAYRTATEERDKARIRNMFGKYVSPTVVDQILENPPELGGVDKELTVFFSDIRGFTTLSENMTPQELVNHLNLYLTAMTDIILEYQGTLDKYVGDEVMCFWGAPLPQPDHAILACKCALRQMQALGELNTTFPPERRINIGIGLNSGIMTVGNMGSMGRMNYTLTGDNVNLGARLEGTNKTYGTNVILSEYTYGLVKDQVIVRELDNIRVKGKNRPVLIYELADVIDGLEPPAKTDGAKKRRSAAAAK